jgi:L-rhamnose mutarotase
MKTEQRTFAFKMTIRPGMEEEYKRRHDDLWPELRALLENSGISEYYIFLDRDTSTLFAFQKVSGKGNSQELGNHPVVQKWWKYMSDISISNPDHSPVSVPLEEMFKL